MKHKYLMAILITSALFAGCKNDRKAEMFENNATKLNKKCPVRVDSLIILDSTAYNRDKNSMTYYYSASGSLDDSVLINENYASVKKSLRDGVDNSVDMRKYKENQVTFIYKFSSASNGKPLATFTLPTKSDKRK